MIETSARLLLMSLICAVSVASAQWKDAFTKSIREIDAEYAGQFGIYVHHFSSGENYSFRGDERWYLASGIKVFVAIAVFRQIDEGKLKLTTTLPIEKSDYVDGPGALTQAAIGSRHSVLHLLEQMLMSSDNTATDILIRKIGIDQVNALTKPFHFERITTLAQVRRQIYGQIHPAALAISNADLLRLGQLRADADKIALLQEILPAPPSEWKRKSVESAYIGYYASGANSASLKAYSRIMVKLFNGELLKPESTKTLTEVMERAQTGENRIKKGFPEDITFAHKTGTQRKRICDFGVVRREGANLVLVSACTRGLGTSEAEKVLEKIGLALNASGIFTNQVVDGE